MQESITLKNLVGNQETQISETNLSQTSQSYVDLQLNQLLRGKGPVAKSSDLLKSVEELKSAISSEGVSFSEIDSKRPGRINTSNLVIRLAPG